MDTIAVLGAVCIVASAVGGGCRAFNVEIPFLPPRRQILLGIVGVGFLVLGLTLPTLQGAFPDIFGQGGATNSDGGHPSDGNEVSSAPDLSKSSSVASAVRREGAVTLPYPVTIDLDTEAPDWGAVNAPLDDDSSFDLAVAAGNGLDGNQQYGGGLTLVRKTPNLRTCESQTSYVNSLYTGLQKGAKGCVRTTGGRYAAFIVKEHVYQSNQFLLKVTVWSRG